MASLAAPLTGWAVCAGLVISSVPVGTAQPGITRVDVCVALDWLRGGRGGVFSAPEVVGNWVGLRTRSDVFNEGVDIAVVLACGIGMEFGSASGCNRSSRGRWHCRAT